MRFKTAINTFLRALYKICTGILIIIAVILILIVAINIGFSLSLDKPILIFFTVVIVGIIFYVLQNKRKLSESKTSSSSLFFEIIKLGFYTVLFFVLVFNITRVDFKEIDAVVKDETVKLYTDSTGVRISKFYLSQQSWVDFKRKKHTMPFKVKFDEVIKSSVNRNSFKITHQFTWGNFYKILADSDRPFIEELAQTFHGIQKKENMNRRDFAELMITAIQDIPYVLTSDQPCDSLSTKPCIGNIKFGIYAPAEFVSNLSGDCDTRTVLLFTLLSRFNFDIAILNSVAYRHSVLGINLPSTGKFKTHKNKKYYFIETTAKNCPIGYLARDVSDISKWDFALIHHIKN